MVNERMVYEAEWMHGTYDDGEWTHDIWKWMTTLYKMMNEGMIVKLANEWMVMKMENELMVMRKKMNKCMVYRR